MAVVQSGSSVGGQWILESDFYRWENVTYDI